VVQWSAEYDAGRISNESKIQYNNMYKQVRKTSQDPFLWMVFSIMSCNFLESTPQEVLRHTQDWLWYRLHIIRDFSAPTGGQNKLGEFVEFIRQCGSRHFSNGGRSPLSYVQICLLTQQWNEAVNFLFSTPEYYRDAVHFTLALHYYKLLQRDANCDRKETADARVDAAEALRSFTEGFSCEEIVAYLSFIQDEEKRGGRAGVPRDHMSNRDTAYKNALLTLHYPYYLDFYNACKSEMSKERLDIIFLSAGWEQENKGKYDEAIQLLTICHREEEAWRIRKEYIGAHISGPTL